VPVRWIPAIAQLNDRDVVSALHDLRLRHLLEPVDLDGTPAVRITSRTVEQAVMRDQDAATLTDIHARYVERMTKNGGFLFMMTRLFLPSSFWMVPRLV
jgi:hypothetical protein